jgi:hypothetical protein
LHRRYKLLMIDFSPNLSPPKNKQMFSLYRMNAAFAMCLEL